MPAIKVSNGGLTIRLILNTDGALVCKSPPYSAWPVFLAVADLPPKKRQLFQNVVLVSLFVGSGYPDFDLIFNHLKKELETRELITYNNQDLVIGFEPILFISDLVAKSKVLKMEQFNGYYGCTLCTQRGVRFSGAHHYPHTEKFVMRSPESHLLNITELENGSIEEIRARHGRKVDCEKRTQGVKGRSVLLSVIRNQPLSSPIDPMHQLFLGVGKDLLSFFYEQMKSEHKSELNKVLSDLILPIELKNTVRSLDVLSTFKAKEVKTVLLYLSPILLSPYLLGEDKNSNRQDLNKLVFALRTIFDCSENSEIADELLCEFCVSMHEKTNKMDSINFHLLRHLGWQARNIGPLFVTSAAMFESANRLLLAPLTGTVNHCELLVQRFIRAKLVLKMGIENDCLSSLLENFRESKEFDDSYSLSETEEVRNFRQNYPEFRVFCKNHENLNLSSAAYGRGSSADCFVATHRENLIIGEILFFFARPEKMVMLKQFKILKKIKLNPGIPDVMPYGFIVEETDEKVELPLSSVSTKFLRFEFKSELYFITLMQHFEHN